MGKPNPPGMQSYKAGVGDGYEQGASLIDAMALTWKNGTANGHEVAAKALLAAAECLRKLKKTI